MWCFISQPNSVVLEIEIDPKADGQECLDKVCQQLNIIETDYFGLQYHGSKGEKLWLNLRNRVEGQLDSPAPYRFELRVKFFVPPHQLQQNTTRHQFFLHTKREIQSGHLRIETFDHATQISAFIAQADLDDALPNQMQWDKYKELGSEEYVSNQAFVPTVASKHAELRGMTREKAEYQMLQEASELENYGVELHYAKTISTTGAQCSVRLGVGPEGVMICDVDNTCLESISYPLIRAATHNTRCVLLTIVRPTAVMDGVRMMESTRSFRLCSQKAAIAMYRCVTEMHSFYRCDTVRNAVSEQCKRDLIGTIASFFVDNSNFGKNYIFDIRRTSREAHDHARRKLYMLSHCQRAAGQATMSDEEEDDEEMDDCDNATIDFQEPSSEMKMSELESRVRDLHDAWMCRICCDNTIDSVLCQCGHVCCKYCATNLETCPFCRAPISLVQPFYIPDRVASMQYVVDRGRDVTFCT